MRDRLIQQQEAAQKLEQDKVEQQNQYQQQQLQQEEQQHQQDVANDNYQKELDRINKKEIAIIQATAQGKVASTDENANGVPDVLEVNKVANEQMKAAKDYQLQAAQIASTNAIALEKLQVEREKLKVDMANQINDLQIARENSKNRATKKKK